MSYNAERELSGNEYNAFKELKNIIVGEFGPDAAKDERIVRYLRARDYDVKQAREMLKKHLEWRKKHHVDTIIQDYHMPEVYEKYVLVSLIGFDKEGSAVIVCSYGRFDHKGFNKCTTTEEMLQNVTYSFELCEQILSEHQQKVENNHIRTWTVIVDMEEFSVASVMTKYIFQRGIEISQFYDANYPERLKCCYFINVPTSSYILFSMIKPFVASKTLEKYKFLDNDSFKEELLKVIDAEVLPAYLGGKRTDPDGNPMCPSIICPGGKVEEKYYLKNQRKCNLRNQEGVKSHILKRRSKFNLPFEVREKDSVIEWEIETDNHDIGIGLFYQALNFSAEDKLVPLIPMQIFDSHLMCETGTFKCEKVGTYIITLDNSYSFLRSKNIYYRVSVIKPSKQKTDV